MPEEQIVPNSGENRFMRRALSGSNLQLMLFVNDPILSATNSLADFTAPAFAEYAPIDLLAVDDVSGNGWSEPATDADGRGSSSHPEVGWAYNGAVEEQIAGYMIVDPSDNTLITVFKFESARQVIDNGELYVTPQLKFYDERDVSA